jgi:hypothetical protein
MLLEGGGRFAESGCAESGSPEAVAEDAGTNHRGSRQTQTGTARKKTGKDHDREETTNERVEWERGGVGMASSRQKIFWRKIVRKIFFWSISELFSMGFRRRSDDVMQPVRHIILSRDLANASQSIGT